MSSSDSELSESDAELQQAFVDGKLKPGLNIVETPKEFVNNVSGLKQKLEEFKLKLSWIEQLDCVNKQAPLAPELAAQMLTQEQQRESQLKNNKKLPQYTPSEDPVLNDFKREMTFHRQAQAAVTEAIPRLKAMGIATKRPDDYFAEMAKTDAHMQKIREHLMKKQEQQKRSERVKQLRQQRKQGKLLQIQTKLQRQQEKKEILEQVKKVRKGISKNLDFLDGKQNKAVSKKAVEKRKMKNKKFGFGGKKKGMKANTKDSAADISEYKRPNKNMGKGKMKSQNKNRPGKNRRIKNKSRGKNNHVTYKI
ncbi:probable rRNA-processing protein EBP2 homolog [Anoplophora glabripennis]|uniref:probable rRNA-processing protein EBP2 homolog n=1 Tax=Anoplophora glabripennis TaxID=217634 RepID=UPI000874BC22|nr:probable rRNA-processing protein EBP2 homolog [Anoplophora glabripennis]